jgi:glycogen debranching enzyme
MADVPVLDDPFAILTEAERSPAPVRVLKDDDTFTVFNVHGDIVPGPGLQHGLYYSGTRFLSGFELLLAGRQPLLLSSTVSDDNVVFSADLTNSDVVRDSHVVLGRGTIHLLRARVLQGPTLVERVRVTNHGFARLEIPLSMRLAADFADVFEVRGTRRHERGQLSTSMSRDGAVLSYRGLDGVERRARVRSVPAPDRAADLTLAFRVTVEPRASAEIELTVSCELDRQSSTAPRYTDAVEARRQTTGAEDAVSVVTSNYGFNRWVQRSIADLRMMVTATSHGRYPYAGIPWYSTPFGRDGLITAMQLLWAAPEIARGVLGFLAATQAIARDDARDAQPGKIVHEMRDGEMAALGEVPFGRYYGSADATPLFVMLAHAYYERTADLAFIDELWPNLLAALDWMDAFGDVDGDGFIEYTRQSDAGLAQQGWKDSWDSVFHEDGALARPPIALCEVQAYAYAAWTGAAALAAARGDTQQAERWRQRASTLQDAFERAFWLEDLGTYALALDGDKQPCRVRTSNAGHCLFAGIADRDRARRVAATIMGDSSFGGWGVRTVAAGAARYNPMSYHNGSIWPHDNAIVAAGLARYGMTGAALQILRAMFDLSQAVDLQRLPELICGFHRRSGDAPTLYPVACAPQAWAAGAVSMLLQACLGLQVDGVGHRVTFAHTVLPEDIDWLQLRRLTVGNAVVDLLLTRHGADVGLTVMRRDGDLEIAVTK